MNGDDRFKTVRAKRADLEIAAQDRLSDAEILFQGGRSASAIAMGLYSLELYLKVAICKRLELDGLLRAFEIHDLDAILHLTGLRKSLDDPAVSHVKFHWDEITSNNPQFSLNSLRYNPSANCSMVEASDSLRMLRDAPDGVIPWITTQP